MEIGITLDNKLVYNKEVKITKKVIRNGLIIIGVGAVGIALAVALNRPTEVYAFTLDTVGDGFFDIAEKSTTNSKMLFDTFKNTAQYQDFKALYEFTYGKALTTKDILIRKDLFIELFENNAKSFGSVVGQFDENAIQSVCTALAERKVPYNQGFSSMVEAIMRCMNLYSTVGKF